LLWNLIENYFLKELKTQHSSVRVYIYANDILITVKGKILSIITQQLQDAITTMEGWSRRRGLSFSTDETKAMLWTKKKKKFKYHFYG